MNKNQTRGLLALSAVAAVGIVGLHDMPRVSADHKGIGDTPALFGVQPGGGSGKFYDDREAGQCSLTNWSCYMTLTADVHFPTDATVKGWVTSAKNDWNGLQTTVFFDLRTDQNTAYDVHFKLSTLPNGTFGQTSWGDYHNNNCPGEANCSDPDGIAAHQPQRWWYSYISLDKAQINSILAGKQKAIPAHEMGHALGLAHHENCEGGPSVNTIMYVPCILAGVVTPQDSETCEITHASSPLLYGNDPNWQLRRCF